jgi:hypothetical protein
MLILSTLLFGPAHGHAIAHAIERGSREVLQVEHGSLYPALHRLVKQGLLSAQGRRIGEPPPREVLQSDGEGPQAADCGIVEVGAAHRSDRPRHDAAG